jgi:hypothetical protein
MDIRSPAGTGDGCQCSIHMIWNLGIQFPSLNDAAGPKKVQVSKFEQFCFFIQF